MDQTRKLCYDMAREYGLSFFTPRKHWGAGQEHTTTTKQQALASRVCRRAMGVIIQSQAAGKGRVARKFAAYFSSSSFLTCSRRCLPRETKAVQRVTNGMLKTQNHCHSARDGTACAASSNKVGTQSRTRCIGTFRMNGAGLCTAMAHKVFAGDICSMG